MSKVRIREKDLAIPALRAAAARANRHISTSELIAELTEEFQPDGEDAEILDGRSDTKFSQIVRNLVSHKGSPRSIFSRGYAVHENEGIRITTEGLEFLDQTPE